MCMLQEMAIQIDSLPVFYRQRDTLFYPPVSLPPMPGRPNLNSYHCCRYGFTAVACQHCHGGGKSASSCERTSCAASLFRPESRLRILGTAPNAPCIL